MSELALKLIAENKAKHARGEDASFLDLGNCGLTTLLDLSDMYWLDILILSNRRWDRNQRKWVKSVNTGYENVLKNVPVGLLPVSLRTLYAKGDYEYRWEISNWDFLKDLTNLQFLDLSDNQISNSDFLKDLTSLQFLDLRNNKIRSIDFLKDLTNLQSVYLNNNQISNVYFLKNLINLKSLDLHKNQISNVDCLRDLTNLQSLRLSNNQISNIDFLKDLTNLQFLDLRNNKISSADFLRGLSNLQSLDLSNNQISDFDFLKDLTNLQSLYLRNNQIRNVDFLKNLTNLQSLDLCSNQIINWDFLRGLTNLRSLDLSDHLTRNWFFLTELTNLQAIDLRTNKTENWDFLKDLTNLQALYLRNNKITNVGFLEDLINLQSLDLTNNQITSVEPFLHLIEKKIPVILGKSVGIGIRLNQNPFTHPPVEIIAQGNEAILRYFEDLKNQGSDQIYEAKLLLIGEGGAGKTSLCRKLFDPRAALPQEKERTKGIDIHPLYFKIPEKPDKQFRLNIWDFAGQGKYQSAHSFFYTHRSLYVLVDDTRTLNENDAYRTLYNNWLQTTELFGGKSPVLVLHNEKEGCARTGFSLGGFQERFAFVHGELFRINLGGSDAGKINDLRHQIERQALALPHIGDTVPKTWVKVREALETERQQQPYISIERYRSICVAEGISDSKRQGDLSRYFHDLGVFLHFQDNPLLKRDVFLQNQWVTDAVYKILDDVQIADQQRGRFSKVDLTRLWHENTYSERRDELLALMLQFELCYQVQDSETYVCPQLLPGDIPAYQLGSDIPLQLKYEYTFMPKGLLYRLIVRLHRHIAQGQTAVWNSGVVLERNGAKAEITESLDRRTISVRATGLYAKELVTIINEEVERLHAPFGDRLKVSVKIPCNCRVCKKSDKPHFYEKSDLDNRIFKGKTTVECKESFDDVSVLGLLEGVFSKHTKVTPDQIKVLIQAGKTAQALEAMCELNYPDAPTLKARFTKAQKEYLGGRIEYKEYEQIANQVNAGCLDLL